MQFQENTLQYFKQHEMLNIPPKNNRNILINKIKPFISPESNILNVSAKTGEFIHDITDSSNIFSVS